MTRREKAEGVHEIETKRENREKPGGEEDKGNRKLNKGGRMRKEEGTVEERARGGWQGLREGEYSEAATIPRRTGRNVGEAEGREVKRERERHEGTRRGEERVEDKG